jgi:hypothetical protein
MRRSSEIEAACREARLIYLLDQWNPPEDSPELDWLEKLDRVGPFDLDRLTDHLAAAPDQVPEEIVTAFNNWTRSNHK